MKFSVLRVSTSVILASAILLAGCGGEPDPAAGGMSPPVQGMETPSATAPQSGPVPDGDAVTGVFDGKSFEAALITECLAVPGYALGFNSTTEDYVSNTAGEGLRIGGGFEEDQGRLSANYLGRAWKAGMDSDGELGFALTDARSDDGMRQFVTVNAEGTFVDEAGESVTFNVSATCEVGGR